MAEVLTQKVCANFKVGDHAVYPGHGVGRVVAVEVKEFMNTKLEFYSVQILETGLKIKDVKIDTQTWNRRYREYMEKIKTGSVYEIAEVLRDLFLLKVDKELSFGERKMLDTARGLLMKELTLAVDHGALTQEEEVRLIFGL